MEYRVSVVVLVMKALVFPCRGDLVVPTFFCRFYKLELPQSLMVEPVMDGIGQLEDRDSVEPMIG